MPAVVHEEVDRGVALEDAGGHRLHCLAVGDVAHLDLGADLVRERPQAVLPARDEHAAPVLLREQPSGRLSDPGGRSRYDRDALNAVTVPRLTSTVSRMSSA